MIAENVTAGALEAQSGFDKDAWPIEADARFAASEERGEAGTEERSPTVDQGLPRLAPA